MELEKVSLNLTPAELGQIDVLVARGLYASRTDVLRSGIRLVLDEHREAVDRVTQGSTGLGYMVVTQRELEAARKRGERVRMFVVGVLRIEETVTPALADAAIERIYILGALRAPEKVIARLGDRVVRGLPSALAR